MLSLAVDPSTDPLLRDGRHFGRSGRLEATVNLNQPLKCVATYTHHS